VTPYEIMNKYERVRVDYAELTAAYPRVFPDPEEAYLDIALGWAVTARYGDIALGGFNGPRSHRTP